MSRWLMIGAALAVSGFAFSGVCVQATQQAEFQEQHDYLDDDDRRPLADLRFDVEPTHEQNLKITVSALGPNVEPIAGFRGIRGANRYTAEELELILAGQHKVEIITEFENGQSVTGRILNGRSGAIPERRLLPTGRINFLAQTLDEYPLELIIDPQTQSSGRRKTVVIVNGRARLRCIYNIVDGHVEGLEVQSAGGHSFLADMLAPESAGSRLRVLLASIQKSVPPVSDIEWNARDLEAKWVFLSTQIASEPAKISAWVDFLKQKKEFQLLEWMAIYVPDAFKSHGVADALKSSDSPQWIRVVAWHTTGPFYLGHGEQQATSLLTSAPGVAEHWLDTHKEKIEPWEGMISQIYEGFKSDDVPPMDSGKYLPPLQVVDVFSHLAKSGSVVDFADRKQAQPEAVYVHQIVREINGVAVSGRRNPELLNHVRQLTAHSNETIRQTAFLAHTYILPSTPSLERFDDFARVADDSKESAGIRESALMAFSYHNHPGVLLKLHQVASDTKHPAWNAAVSRIGDIGRGFSISRLKELQKATLTTDQSKLLNDSLQRLIERESAQRGVASWDMARRIVLAVYAQQSGDPNAKHVREWVLTSKAQMTQADAQDLKTRWSFRSVNDFWHPTSVSEFEKSYNELRAEVLK
ncbi:MAG: hypothetical protein JNL58_00415 [Planctomyces sp.]|nr:hypothetical protein [Planctomyces sp.]